MLKTISKKQLYRHIRKEIPKPTKVEKDSKFYYNRKQKHKDVWLLDDSEV